MEYNRKILVVVRWPLGGIRTYMRYTFSHFPDYYKITLIAASTQENSALFNDIRKYGDELKIVRIRNIFKFAIEIFKELNRKSYDLIISQGFLSATAVFPANLLFRIPHILTIHGIIEKKYISGRFSSIKRRILLKVLTKATALYSVGNEILENLFSELPQIKSHGIRSFVIRNGIDLNEFKSPKGKALDLRNEFDLEPTVFLFGFFGRFMPQKGFDLIIDAIDLLQKENKKLQLAVLAVGSGDYLQEYKNLIYEKQILKFFYFLPFQPEVYRFYPQLDAVIMPSRWEASPLLAMEVLCMGTPLIASDCMGLSETVLKTPAFIFQSGNVSSLVSIMKECIEENKRDLFKKYLPKARLRYDVARCSEKLIFQINSLITKK